jgi:hypothetical protein
MLHRFAKSKFIGVFRGRTDVENISIEAVAGMDVERKAIVPFLQRLRDIRYQLRFAT